MELNQESLSPYLGGQIEIRGRQGRAIQRGQLSSFVFTDEQLTIVLAWNALAEDGNNFLPLNRPKYFWDLRICYAQVAADHLIVSLPTGDLATFFRKDHSSNILPPRITC